MAAPTDHHRELAHQFAAACGAIIPAGQAAGPLSPLAQLQPTLSKFIGAEGFASLLRRALTLAAAEQPSLDSFTVSPEGRVVPHGDVTTAAPSAEHETLVLSHLIALLGTFIGEPITLRLVQRAWPGRTGGA